MLRQQARRGLGELISPSGSVPSTGLHRTPRPRHSSPPLAPPRPGWPWCGWHLPLQDAACPTQGSAPRWRQGAETASEGRRPPSAWALCTSFPRVCEELVQGVCQAWFLSRLNRRNRSVPRAALPPARRPRGGRGSLSAAGAGQFVASYEKRLGNVDLAAVSGVLPVWLTRTSGCHRACVRRTRPVCPWEAAALRVHGGGLCSGPCALIPTPLPRRGGGPGKAGRSPAACWGGGDVDPAPPSKMPNRVWPRASLRLFPSCPARRGQWPSRPVGTLLVTQSDQHEVFQRGGWGLGNGGRRALRHLHPVPYWGCQPPLSKLPPSCPRSPGRRTCPWTTTAWQSRVTPTTWTRGR